MPVSVLVLVMLLAAGGTAAIVLGGLTVLGVILLVAAALLATMAVTLSDPATTLARLKAKQATLLAGPNTVDTDLTDTGAAAATDAKPLLPNRAARRAAGRKAPRP